MISRHNSSDGANGISSEADEKGLETTPPPTSPRGFDHRTQDAAVDQEAQHDTASERDYEVEDTRSGLERALCRTRSKAGVGPPPDGGARAWITAGCVHLVIMNTWGYINAFGTFQSYYTSTLGMDASSIAWIGSIQIFFLFAIGTFTGRATDAGYFRACFVLGSVLQALGLFCTAQATTYWQVFLAQGVCMGLGNGFCFCPTMATLSTYFNKRRSFAIGIGACGGGTGGIIFPGIVRGLLDKVGFAWTVRTLGFLQVATMIIANFGIRPRLPPRRTGRIVEWAAFKESEYAFYAAGSFTIFWGIYVAFFHLASFARDEVHISYISSLDVIMVVCGLGVIGRLVPNFFADRIGAINLYSTFCISAGVIALCWMAVDSEPGLYAWSVLYGITAGGIQSLFPAGLTSLTTDLSKAGVRMGMIFTIVAFSTLTGPPIAGAIIDAQGGKYQGAQGFAGATLIFGGMLLVCARFLKARKTGLGLWAKV